MGKLSPRIPREHNKYNGYTVRGTPHCPLKYDLYVSSWSPFQVSFFATDSLNSHFGLKEFQLDMNEPTFEASLPMPLVPQDPSGISPGFNK